MFLQQLLQFSARPSTIRLKSLPTPPENKPYTTAVKLLPADSHTHQGLEAQHCRTPFQPILSLPLNIRPRLSMRNQPDFTAIPIENPVSQIKAQSTVGCGKAHLPHNLMKSYAIWLINAFATQHMAQ